MLESIDDSGCCAWDSVRDSNHSSITRVVALEAPVILTVPSGCAVVESDKAPVAIDIDKEVCRATLLMGLVWGWSALSLSPDGNFQSYGHFSDRSCSTLRDSRV